MNHEVFHVQLESVSCEISRMKPRRMAEFLWRLYKDEWKKRRGHMSNLRSGC
jgi:hypothetical protein